MARDAHSRARLRGLEKRQHSLNSWWSEYSRLMNQVAYLTVGGDLPEGSVISRQWVKEMWGHDLARHSYELEQFMGSPGSPDPYHYLRSLVKECAALYPGLVASGNWGAPDQAEREQG
jgi:hypothetical protein